jgi:hypothetical protein
MGTKNISVEKLVIRVSKATKISPDQVRVALAEALALLQRHGSGKPLDQLFASYEGSRALAATIASGGPRPLLGRVISSVGGRQGAVLADALAMMDRLALFGLDRGDLKRIARAAREQSEEWLHRDLMTAAVRTVPGVARFLDKT